VAWAKNLTDDNVVAEFFLGPASLEDVYVRRVRPEEQEADHAAIVR
jgi:hypothetical protein